MVTEKACCLAPRPLCRSLWLGPREPGAGRSSPAKADSIQAQRGARKGSWERKSPAKSNGPLVPTGAPSRLYLGPSVS